LASASLTWIKKIGVSAGVVCVRRGLIRSAHSANFKTGLFDGGDASRPTTIRAIDLDQCDRIAFRFAFKKEGKYTRKDRGVSS
jgi:hypothetical protein